MEKFAKSLTSQNYTKPGKYKPSIETGINLVLGWYSLKSLSLSLVAQKFCKVFFLFCKCDHNGRNLGKILGFCKL